MASIVAISASINMSVGARTTYALGDDWPKNFANSPLRHSNLPGPWSGFTATVEYTATAGRFKKRGLKRVSLLQRNYFAA